MSERIKSSAKYNQRAAIIEDLRAGRSQIEIIQFFVYPRPTVYNIAAKYLALKTSEKVLSIRQRRKRKIDKDSSNSKEKSVRIPAIIERAKELISEAPELSLTKLAISLWYKWYYNTSNC